MKIENSNNYKLINSCDLYEGMHIEYEVFYKYKNEFVLAFRNSTLTKELLIKLQKLEITYGHLYVEEKNYDDIYSKIKKFISTNKKHEFNTQYTQIKTKTSNIINQAAEKQTIDKEESNKISIDIKDKILSLEASDILHIINSVRNDDHYLYTHSTNVAFLNGLMGKWLDMPEKDISTLTKIGLLHDIGKTMIPDSILNKPSVLTADEFEIIKKHPIHSFDILVKSGETDIEVLLAVRGHHEKTNGTGYPDHLNYERITLFSRITTISDIYDAMVSKRVYKDLHSPFEILEEFANGRFSNLDTHLINVFLQNMPKELIGKSVLLSDGSIGTVMYINPNNYAYPIVKINDKVISTTPELKCISTFEVN